MPPENALPVSGPLDPFHVEHRAYIRILERVEEFEGDKERFIDSFKNESPYTGPRGDSHRRNLPLALGHRHGYGIVSQNFEFTPFGKKLYSLRHSEEEFYDEMATKILSELHGLKVLEAIIRNKIENPGFTRSYVERMLNYHYGFGLSEESRSLTALVSFLAKANVIEQDIGYLEYQTWSEIVINWDIVNRLLGTEIATRATDNEGILEEIAKEIKEHQKYDVFICHASEDKDRIVQPLAESLSELGARVWYDDFELTLGDSLRESIDQGLINSRHGIVILSESFFEKDWTKYELNSLTAMDVGNTKVILPLWYNVNREYVLQQSPALADKLAEKITEDNIQEVSETIYNEIGRIART